MSAKANSTSAPIDLAAAINAGRSGRKSMFWFFFLLLVIAGSAYGYYWWSNQQKLLHQAPAFVTEPVKRGDISLTIVTTGNLEPTNEVTVGSELSGTTLEVYVDTNDHVTKGQPLAKLDTTKLSQQTAISRASVNSAKAKITQAEATVRESKAILARQQELHRISGGKIPSKSDLDSAVATAERAAADLLNAQAAALETEAQVRINENDLAKAIIKSPIDGIVLKRSLEPGQTVAASFTAPELFIIAEKLEHMKLLVTVAEADIGRVAKDQKASFTVDAWPDRSYTASVVKVSYGSAVTNNVVTYETELEVINDDLSLRPGMTATAEIRVAESKDVLLVPTASLRFDPNAVAAGGPGAGGPPGAAGSPEKKTFVQSLIPTGPRRGSGGGRPGGGGPGGRGGNAEGRPNRGSGSGGAKIWILRNGKPEAVMVKTGLSDGRNTEVSSEDLKESMEVITRANPAPVS